MARLYSWCVSPERVSGARYSLNVSHATADLKLDHSAGADQPRMRVVSRSNLWPSRNSAMDAKPRRKGSRPAGSDARTRKGATSIFLPRADSCSHASDRRRLDPRFWNRQSRRCPAIRATPLDFPRHRKDWPLTPASLSASLKFDPRGALRPRGASVGQCLLCSNGARGDHDGVPCDAFRAI